MPAWLLNQGRYPRNNWKRTRHEVSGRAGSHEGVAETSQRRRTHQTRCGGEKLFRGTGFRYSKEEDLIKPATIYLPDSWRTPEPTPFRVVRGVPLFGIRTVCGALSPHSGFRSTASRRVGSPRITLRSCLSRRLEALEVPFHSPSRFLSSTISPETERRNEPAKGMVMCLKGRPEWTGALYIAHHPVMIFALGSSRFEPTEVH